jgi:transcriptional regulator with GAF, ATPase, and Fis domain
LIGGESGTGKELFAQLIHDQSQRSSKPFIALNCAAIPAELMESELFGHERGAFSGAITKKDGLFVQADGGTLFLDEIGDMPLPLQAKILRVLQEGIIRPVGSKFEKSIDVRIVAATHRNLAEMVLKKKFREDLIFRLKRYTLHLPPLRERGRDIITLARVTLRTHKEFSKKSLGRDAQIFLMAQSWPGNVRELQNAILAAAVDSPRTIAAQHIRPYIDGKEDVSLETEVPIKDRLLSAIETGKKITLSQLHADLQVPKPTLHRHLTSLVNDGKIKRITKEETIEFTIISEAPSDPLSDRQTQAIALVKTEGRITRQQYADTFGISIRTASRDLIDIVKRGILEPDGQPGRFAGYAIPI